MPPASKSRFCKTRIQRSSGMFEQIPSRRLRATERMRLAIVRPTWEIDPGTRATSQQNRRLVLVAERTAHDRLYKPNDYIHGYCVRGASIFDFSATRFRWSGSILEALQGTSGLAMDSTLTRRPSPAEHAARARSSGPPQTCHVEEYGRCEGHRVEAVKHAAMPVDHASPVLGSAITLDRRHHEPADEAGRRDRQRDERGLPRRERGDPVERRAERRCARDAADEPLPCLRRGHNGRQLAPAAQLAPDIL